MKSSQLFLRLFLDGVNWRTFWVSKLGGIEEPEEFTDELKTASPYAGLMGTVTSEI